MFYSDVQTLVIEQRFKHLLQSGLNQQLDNKTVPAPSHPDVRAAQKSRRVAKPPRLPARLPARQPRARKRNPQALA